jgi:hypothetical protein
MATSPREGYNNSNSFLDKYRTNLNTPRSTTSQQSNYISTQQPSQTYGNNYDTSLLRSGSVIRDERMGNEILARAGPSHHYQHPQYRTHEIISADGRLDNYNVQTDHEPLHVVKPTDQNIHYKQQVNVRFLQPPPAPEPAPIIIKERHAPAQPPPPPVVIRQRPPTPPTPPPLIIRERPPTPPSIPQQPQYIEKVLPAPPPQPRQVIVERLPQPPPKPRQVIYEKWLPHPQVKERPVVVERAPPPEIIRPPKNVIIQYEQPKAHHQQVVVNEGVYRADPQTHTATSAAGELRVVDKITDLPLDYSKFLADRPPESVQNRSLSSPNFYEQQPLQPQFSQTEPTQQYRTTNYNYPGAYTTTYRSSYTNQGPNRSGYGPYGQPGGTGGNPLSSYTKYV